MKKFLSILMAIMMVAMLGITAFADDEPTTPTTYTITVANTVSGQDYSLYKLLDLSYNVDADAYYYTVNSDWEDFFDQESIEDYVTIGAAGDVTWVTGADAQAFAQAALAYATDKTHTIAPVATTKATADGASFTVTELGYYLVSTSLGALVALDTVSKEAITVYEKNDYPTLTKTVKEDSTGVYGETATADEGENVSFKLHVEVPNNHTYTGITDDGVNKDFIITDTLPAGMTYVGKAVLSDDTTPDSSLTVDTVVNTDGTTTVTFTVAQAYITTTDNKTFDITYDAKLNNAAIAGTAETNTAKLTYGTFVTTDDTASLTTYKIDVYKYTMNGNDKKGLADATFKLYKMSGDVKLYFVKAADGSVSWTANESEATSYTTTEAGGYTITFDGLDDDTYYVEETQAPAGYNPQTAPTEVKITKDNVTSNRLAEVLNNTGSELPSTGGIGTTIFYVVGGILMAGAVVLLVTKKKMSVK
ncbi:MAG: SpaH/EbpB family LPXTG-anchored major pilin [Eubacteriales bacterium]